MGRLGFTLQAGEGVRVGPRAGTITTDHGEIPTPIFMPVGTVGSVKGVDPLKLVDPIGARIILGNTYHLYLRPGTETLEAMGGLHRMARWDRPMLTDSGGYQVFSLSGRRKITEEGVTFQSHLDGSRHMFTPERVMDIQRSIGADIIMALDECPPYPATRDYTEKSMHLTHRWLARCQARLAETEPLYGHDQNLFPILQGGGFMDLRRQSAEHIAGTGAAGHAIGGLSVGEPAELMYETLEVVNEILPADKPRYLMGVGTPANILEAIGRGVDMFDCVMPTRNGRNGMIFTTEGIINIRNKKWAQDPSPLDPNLPGWESTCSKSYVRHLFVAGELLAYQIGSVQNLAFYLWLVGQARQRILEGTFQPWATNMARHLMQRL